MFFAWFERSHDGMPRRVVMSGRVTVLRRVAAADVAAGQAHPQVDPRAADLQALVASVVGRGDLHRPDDVLTYFFFLAHAEIVTVRSSVPRSTVTGVPTRSPL